MLENTYYNSGIYVDSTSSVDGCDSILTLNLTVLSITETMINPIICPRNEYILDGNFTSTGIYQVIYNAHNACDSKCIDKFISHECTNKISA